MVLESILKELGMKPPISHIKKLETYIQNRVDFLKLNDISYLDYLKKDSDEYYRLLDKLTVNETYFFREQKHFDLLQNIILPELKVEKRHIKIWSAACATGEEAISLYYLCENILQEDSFTIFASDINYYSLKFFNEGKFSRNSLRQDGEKYHYLLPDVEHIKNSVLNRIDIFNKNLFDMVVEDKTEYYDIIFLRNTLIYFTTENKTKVIENLVDMLKPNGYLFVSVTEVPFIKNSCLKVYECHGCYYFKKEPKAVENRVEFLEEIETEIIEPREFDYKECLEFCFMNSNDSVDLNENRLDSLEYKMARKVIKILSLIDNSDKKYVERELELLPNSTPLTLYLHGYYFYVMGNYQSSLHFLKKCLILDNTFWPASFYISSISREKEHIVECLTSIELYVQRGYKYFDILLDGFNALYFKKICNNWLN